MTKPCPMCGAEQRVTGQSINPPGPERVEPCKVCGERHCEETRAAFAREPFLRPCFDLGAQWYSFDRGMTWTRQPTIEQIKSAVANDIMRFIVHTMTVTKIDGTRAEVTVRIGP